MDNKAFFKAMRRMENTIECFQTYPHTNWNVIEMELEWLLLHCSIPMTRQYNYSRDWVHILNSVIPTSVTFNKQVVVLFLAHKEVMNKTIA